MLASATSIRSVSESMPVRFFALATRASGILPRTTWVRSPRNSPSFSAMTITSRSLLERMGLSFNTPACFLLREELDWAPRFTTYLLGNGLHRHFRVAQKKQYCSTTFGESLKRRVSDLQLAQIGKNVDLEWQSSEASSHAAIRRLPRLGDHPSPRQRNIVGIKQTRLAAVQHHPPDEGRFAFQGISERANPNQVTCGHLTARLNFQRYPLAGFFQNEIHFVPRTVAPIMQLAPL